MYVVSKINVIDFTAMHKSIVNAHVWTGLSANLHLRLISEYYMAGLLIYSDIPSDGQARYTLLYC